MTDKFM